MAYEKIKKSFTIDGVDYKDIIGLYDKDRNSFSVRVAGNASMIRQYLKAKYPQFTGAGVLWVTSSSFANGNSTSVKFNRIPENYFETIKDELEKFEYGWGHYASKYENAEFNGMKIDYGTKYLSVSNQPPYDSKESKMEAPDWDTILNSNKPSKPSNTSISNSNDELIYVFNGWKMYKRITSGSKIIFVVVKDKDTPSNKESWDLIKSEIYTETGFQWNKSFQVFSKFTNLPDGVFAKLETIFEKYYPNAKPSQVQIPQSIAQEEPRPTYENVLSTQPPTNDVIKNLLKTFKDPKEITDLEIRKYIINTLLDRVESLYEIAKSDKNFLKNYSAQIFSRFTTLIPNDNNIYDVASGIKFDFSSNATTRQTKKELLLRIMDIAGCWAGLDVVYGVYVTVQGEANSPDNIKYEEKEAKEDGREVYIENIHIGGTLRALDWYALNNTLEIAKDFLENRYEASFKYPDFTDKFKKSLANQGEVELDSKDYKGNDIIQIANLYSYLTTDEYVIVLEQGGYSAIYSDSFNLGYATMQKLIKNDSGLLSYVKNVDPFAGHLVGAREYIPQLEIKFPEIFRKSTPVEDREIVQQQIDELENFLKIAGDMDDEDKKSILSQILDLHTLLKLI